MIPAPPGIEALYSIHRDGRTIHTRRPVVAFDLDGYPLIAGADIGGFGGELSRARDGLSGQWKFDCIEHCPTTVIPANPGWTVEVLIGDEMFVEEVIGWRIDTHPDADSYEHMGVIAVAPDVKRGSNAFMSLYRQGDPNIAVRHRDGAKP